MNFIRNSISGGSFRRRQLSLNENPNHIIPKPPDDSDACFETYRHHWTQLEDAVMRTKGEANFSDDLVLIISSHLEHLVCLVEKDLEKNRSSSGNSSCLDHFLNKGILLKICSWSLANEQEDLVLAVSGAIDSVLAAAKKVNKDLDLLRDPSVYKPIGLLFKRYEDEKNSGKCIPAKIETILVSISYYVCVFIVREPSYIDLFYDVATVSNEPKFPMMTLLICNLHQRGAQGQTSRDNLKLLMALAKEHQLLAQFIALHSDLCPIVATGLSAVFSDLPRPLPKQVEKVGMLSAMDVESMKEVENFVTSLEFCDSVLETSSWLIVSRLLDMCYKGFLVPVLGPALFQNTMKEIFAATCYLTLMINRIRHPGLIGIFVKFLLINQHEDKPIIDFLISRMSAQTELRLATLNLFYALINLNCEDVILALSMRYLLPCTHVMLSQRGGILQESDTNCLWAAKFLSYIPATCGSRALGKPRNTELERSSNENEPLSRIRSWSRASNDSGGSERRFGQLAFVNNEKKLFPNQQNDISTSESDCGRLREYLFDSVNNLEMCVNGCRQWTYSYDSSYPPIKDAIRMLRNPFEIEELSNQTKRNGSKNYDESEIDSNQEAGVSSRYPIVDPADIYMYCMEQLTTCLSELKSNAASSPGPSSGYYSINCNVQPCDFLQQDVSFFSKEVQDDLEFWSLMRDDECDSIPVSAPVTFESENDSYQPATPSIGPFLENLTKSIDGWLNNSLEVNLALCSIVSRLAMYPHPLLRSLILNPYLILQPSVPSLAVSIATLKQRIDSALRVHTNPEMLICEARSSLKARFSSDVKKDNLYSSKTNKEVKPRSSKFAGIFGSFVRKDVIDTTILEENSTSNGDESSHRQPEQSEKNDPIGNHVALCAVLLEEWLLELAALCMEHSVRFSPCIIPRTQL